MRSVFGPGYGARSCAVRVVPPATSYDSGYDVDLGSLVGGRAAGSMHLIANDEALIHVWHNELVNATPETWADTRFLPGYKWYRWHLGDASATELPNQTPSTEGGTWIDIDGKTFTLNPNADYSETTLLELDASGELMPRVRVPGWTTNVIRVR